jgi:hypothetical protein
VEILQRGPKSNDTADLEKAESDIITSIFKLLEDFEDTAFEWVKGHQDDDDNTQFADRLLAARLNIECDKAAKEFLKNCKRPTKRPKPLEGVQATLYFGTDMVTKDMNAQIQYASQAPQMTEYIRGVTGWTDAQLGGVNTRGLGIAKKRLPLHRSIRTTKMLYEWLNVGKQKGYMSRDHRCPGCGENNEDFQHLYHCTHPDMQEAFTQAITKAKSRLVKDGIPPDVYNGFIASMCSAAHHPHPDIRYNQSPEDVETVMGLQEQLGQASVLKGFHHVEWASLLQSKWRPKPKPKKGSTTPPQKDALEQSVSSESHQGILGRV